MICKFAAALYKECQELHGMTKKNPILLQNVGMARRQEDENYWVKRAFEAIPAGTDLAIFTDVRFKNEAQAIKDRRGYLIEVVRLNEDGTRFISQDRPADHPSEIELDGYEGWNCSIKTQSAVLTGEIAVTIAEYLLALERKK